MLFVSHYAFCDAKCKFFMIASKLCSSNNDNTSYILMQLSKDIKAGLLPQQYHVVLDEAYPCTAQEMSPWRGHILSIAKDAYNYYASLNHQVIDSAFGMQRRGIFWYPLRISLDTCGVAISVASRIHNIWLRKN
jgi:hypothetical protein